MVINSNIAALTSANSLNKSTNLLNQSLARLSSGSKIVTPADDPAGLAESTLLTATISETSATNANVGNAIAFAQTQDGYLQQVGSALDEMATLAVSAQDQTKTNTERGDYQKEFSTLLTYVSETTSKSFNGVSLFSASAISVPINSGDSISMQGITGNYINAPVTTTTTSTVPYSGSTTLGEISPAYAASSGSILTTGNVLGFTNNYSSQTISPNTTIDDLVNFFNSAGDGGTAAYDTTTGQFSVTLAGNQDAYFSATQENTSANAGNLLTDLGFSTLENSDDSDPFEGFLSHSQGVNDGSSSVTYTTTLAHTVTTSTTTTPTGTPDVSTAADAANALATVTAAINQLATDRATVGANLERLNFTSQSLSTLQTNLSAANSQIADVDVAEESTNYAKEQILVQSGTAMLAQANSAPQSILKLLN